MIVHSHIIDEDGMSRRQSRKDTSMTIARKVSSIESSFRMENMLETAQSVSEQQLKEAS